MSHSFVVRKGMTEEMVNFESMNWKHILLLTLLSFCASPESEDSETAHLLESIASPVNANASLPHLIKGADGNLYLSWVEKGDSNITSFKYSMMTENWWTSPEMIAEGKDWFVNWADYPMIAIDTDGNKIAHYLAKSSAGTFSYDVNIVIKPKDSTSWSDPIIPHKDGTPTEHGFVTMLPNNDGSFLLGWLDGRNTGGGEHVDSGHGGSGAMTLRSAVIDMKGNLSDELQLDNRVCDCCQTGGTKTKDGPMLVYRDRSVDEIRDMAFVTRTNGKWSQPKLVAQDNWNIAGCPVNGPRIASHENTVAVAWYTAALSRSKIKIAFKVNEDFNDPIVVDDTSPLGRVDIAMTNDDTAIVSWMDGGETPAIKYRIVNQNGSMSSVKTVAEISERRGSGFPQMEVFDGYVYFGWTELNEHNTTVKMAKLRLSI
jgi:hypothetical protein